MLDFGVVYSKSKPSEPTLRKNLDPTDTYGSGPEILVGTMAIANQSIFFPVALEAVDFMAVG